MKQLFFLALFGMPFLAHGQNTFPTTGNVGVGTSTPSAILEVKSNDQSYFVNRSINGSTENYTGKAYLLLYSMNDWVNSQPSRVYGKISAIRTDNPMAPGSGNKYTWSVEVNAVKSSFAGNITAYERGAKLVWIVYNSAEYVAIEIPKDLALHSFSFTGYAQNDDMQVVSAQSVSNVRDALLTPISIGGLLHVGNPILNFSQFYVKGNYSSLNDAGDYDPVGASITVEASGSTITGPALEFATSQNGDAPFAPWGRSRIISITNNTDDGTGKMILGTRRYMDKGDGPLWHYGDDLVIDGAGNIGIGTLNPSSKLAVNGTIVTKKLKVSQSASDWPDYVFDSSYQLPSLDSVNAFIGINKRLPGLPSASIVEKEGQDVGEMQKLMLQKIEELTLYVIELKKENAEIKKQLKKQKK